MKGATFSLYRLPPLEESPLTAPAYPSLLEGDSAPAADVLEVELPAGGYVITLLEGWSLELLQGEGASRPVAAGLLSSRAGSFDIYADADARVRFRFEVSSEATPASAEAAPSLDILERPGLLSGRVCLESVIAPEPYTVFAQTDVDALEGCAEVRGELYIRSMEPFDLRPLSRLERVCGSLTLSGPPSTPDASAAAQSLVGLDALAEVDALVLSHPAVESLAPLRSLWRIERPAPALDVLGLFVLQANLEDLSGLENVRQIRNLRLDGSPRLVSMRGLQLPPDMQSVEVRGENLADLAALQQLVSASERLSIACAVQNLSALSNLRRLGSLSLSQNTLLQNAEALGGLESIGELYIATNPLLSTLPVFSSLATVNDVMILGTNVGSLSLPALTSASSIVLSENGGLEQVSLPQLARVDSLEITHNTSLTALDLGSLGSATRVEIFANPLLPDDALARLASGGVESVKIGNNANPDALLSPCPWVSDSDCDEPSAFGSGLCASGSDSDDCNLSFD